MPGLPPSILLDHRKFDAFAHGIDPFGAHADFIAEAPFELARLCATATAAADSSAATATRQSNDDMIAFAKHASRVGEFLECSNGKKAFHEEPEKLDKTAVFLHGNEQPLLIFAEVFLHELSGFPIHPFALPPFAPPLSFAR